MLISLMIDGEHNRNALSRLLIEMIWPKIEQIGRLVFIVYDK